MKRSCQRQTQVFDLPVAAMIAFVPSPSARQKHDPSSPDVLLRRIAVGNDRIKTLTVAVRKGKGNARAHAPELARAQFKGNPPRNSFVRRKPLV